MNTEPVPNLQSLQSDLNSESDHRPYPLPPPVIGRLLRTAAPLPIAYAGWPA
jgi:hypothetical protein